MRVIKVFKWSAFNSREFLLRCNRELLEGKIGLFLQMVSWKLERKQKKWLLFSCWRLFCLLPLLSRGPMLMFPATLPWDVFQTYTKTNTNTKANQTRRQIHEEWFMFPLLTFGQPQCSGSVSPPPFCKCNITVSSSRSANMIDIQSILLHPSIHKILVSARCKVGGKIPSKILKVQGDPKKCHIRIRSSNLFWKSAFTFPQVFWNQNSQPVSSGHFNITHSES